MKRLTLLRLALAAGGLMGGADALFAQQPRGPVGPAPTTWKRLGDTAPAAPAAPPIAAAQPAPLPAPPARPAPPQAAAQSRPATYSDPTHLVGPTNAAPAATGAQPATVAKAPAAAKPAATEPEVVWKVPELRPPKVEPTTPPANGNVTQAVAVATPTKPAPMVEVIRAEKPEK